MYSVLCIFIYNLMINQKKGRANCHYSVNEFKVYRWSLVGADWA